MHPIITETVSIFLGSLGLPREMLISVLSCCYDNLPNNYERWRGRRDPEDPDLFEYVLRLYDGTNWHIFRFSVNDTRATGFLFVEAVSHEFWT